MDIAARKNELIMLLLEVTDGAALERIAQTINEVLPDGVNNTTDSNHRSAVHSPKQGVSGSFEASMLKLRSAGMSSSDFDELIEIGAQAIEATGEVNYLVGVGMSAIVEKLKTSLYFTSLAIEDKQDFLKQLEDKLRGTLDGEVEHGGIRIPKSMIRDAVESGADDMNSLVAVIKSQIKDSYPDVSDTEVRDVIIAYGKMVSSE